MKTYCIDVHFDLACCIHVNADSAEKAEAEVKFLIDSGELDATSSRLEATGDVSVECAGESSSDLPDGSPAGILPIDEENDEKIVWY